MGRGRPRGGGNSCRERDLPAASRAAVHRGCMLRLVNHTGAVPFHRSRLLRTRHSVRATAALSARSPLRAAGAARFRPGSAAQFVRHRRDLRSRSQAQGQVRRRRQAPPACCSHGGRSPHPRQPAAAADHQEGAEAPGSCGAAGGRWVLAGWRAVARGQAPLGLQLTSLPVAGPQATWRLRPLRMAANRCSGRPAWQAACL